MCWACGLVLWVAAAKLRLCGQASRTAFKTSAVARALSRRLNGSRQDCVVVGLQGRKDAKPSNSGQISRTLQAPFKGALTKAPYCFCVSYSAGLSAPCLEHRLSKACLWNKLKVCPQGWELLLGSPTPILKKIECGLCKELVWLIQRSYSIYSRMAVAPKRRASAAQARKVRTRRIRRMARRTITCRRLHGFPQD